MADCYAPEADELHLRWLPREIFADIGIADPEPQPPAFAVAVAPRQQRPLVRGMEAPPGFMTTPGGRGVGNAVRLGGAPAPVAWPAVPPYSYSSGPVHWQVASRSYVNVVAGGGAVDYNPWRLPGPPAPQPQQMQMQMVPNFPSTGGNKVRGGGTGVFLPRADAYFRHAAAPATPLPTAAKDVTAASVTRTGTTVWRPTTVQPQQAAQNAAAARRRAAVQQRRKEEAAAAAAAAGTTSRATSTAGSCSSDEAAAAVVAMLPKEWSYQQ